jgi:two-component system, chemotaxis family, sensor kinase CheA
MAAELQKPATLRVDGEDTEADKAIVEMIVEPLLHVLRNAMDHGIEAPQARLAAGKPAVATIRLNAARRGDNVVLEVSDDGRGIDLERVRQVARERGIAPADAVSAMEDRELFELIFAPGFSTASRVTGVSGRGVGMDAVRTAIKRLGGQVELATEAGKGTTVRFMLPYSVIVSQVMTVRAGEQVFGIPLDTIVETVRVPASRIAPVGSAHAVVLRDRTIPVVYLAGVLGLKPADREPTDAILVVVKVNAGLGALQVDGLGERMEIMLKPLDGLLSGMPGIAGSTLLGDGSVLLVLDLAELLQ